MTEARSRTPADPPNTVLQPTCETHARDGRRTVQILRQVCEMITSGDSASASQILASTLPAQASSTPRVSWTRSRLVRIFVRDGFTDRYFGEPLVFPGALRALSVLLPSLFPYHPNWKQSHTHPAYWAHYPTIDHVIPVARDGADDESNIVTTSMLRNAEKSNWLISELGWPTERASVDRDWDGLLPWFCKEYEKNAALRSQPYLRQWYMAARVA